MSSAGEPSLVSVILPCHNAGAFLESALQSVLDQTYRHLEVLAIDDGSTDRTRAILERMAALDARVRVLINERNQGLIPTLNRGVAEARGAYIARMDADDRCHLDRIRQQVAYLEMHPQVGVLGTSVELDRGVGFRRGTQRVRCLTLAGTRFMAWFANPLFHPTVLARASLMKGHAYGVTPDALHTEDYELFARMIAAGVGLANIPGVLLRKRVHAGSVSLRYEDVQIRNFVGCARRHLEKELGESVSPGPHRVLVNRMDASTVPEDLRRGLDLLDRLEARAVAAWPGAAREVREIAGQQRLDILVQAVRKGTEGVRRAVPLLALRYLGGLGRPAVLRYLASKFRA